MTGRRNGFLLFTTPGPQKPFRREKRHLRVIGYRAFSAIARRVIFNAGFTVFPADGADRIKLDRRTQRIADSTAQKTAHEMRDAQPLVHRPAGVNIFFLIPCFDCSITGVSHRLDCLFMRHAQLHQ